MRTDCDFVTPNRMYVLARRFYRMALSVAFSTVLLSALSACGPSPDELLAVDYAPLPDGEWPVSTPEEAGLDPLLVAELYYDAAKLETLYGLLIVKNGRLIAERYFNDGAVDERGNRQSVTKSFVSALVGIAQQQGCISSVDETMLGVFPELADRITDRRKADITIRDMLKMRAGFPWEETDPALEKALWSGEYLRLFSDFPLVNEPGTTFHYSNLTSDWLGMIVTRACDKNLRSFAEDYLFSPMGIEVGKWTQDRDGYFIGHGELHITARDMAKFGLLYLDDGTYDGNSILPADWVKASLVTYSEDAWQIPVGRNFNDIGYGYQWWSAKSGAHRINLAWGHGGQLVVLVDALEMVVIVTADPLYGQTGGKPWAHEKANINLVADFISDLSSP